MPNYQNGLIYKLCCKDTNITDFYIGSTTSFRHRKSNHKTCCNNEKRRAYNLNLYKFIRENGGFLNWDMVLIEYYKSNSKLELEKREREIIENLKPTLNKGIPTRTKKEYYDANKEQLSEKKKEYRQNNKEKIKEKTKEYYEENKEKRKEYYEQYYENNKEQISEKNKEWYENNKEKLSEKITCECGSIIRKSLLARHKKSIKHNGNIALKNNIDNI